MNPTAGSHRSAGAPRPQHPGSSGRLRGSRGWVRPIPSGRLCTRLPPPSAPWTRLWNPVPLPRFPQQPLEKQGTARRDQTALLSPPFPPHEPQAPLPPHISPSRPLVDPHLGNKNSFPFPFPRHRAQPREPSYPRLCSQACSVRLRNLLQRFCLPREPCSPEET